MNLRQFMAISAGFICPDDAYRYVQLAYEEMVKKVRLHQCVFPVIMNESFRVSGLNTKFDIGVDKIAFKEIRSMNSVTFASPDASIVSTKKLEVFEFNPECYHGIPVDRFNNLNEKHAKVPELILKGDIVQCTNVTGDVFLFLCGYAYPHFVRPVAGVNIISGVDNYSVKDMVTAYGEEYLEVDSALSLIMASKVLSIKALSDGDIALSGNLDYYSFQIVNAYNNQTQLFQSSNMQFANLYSEL